MYPFVRSSIASPGTIDGASSVHPVPAVVSTGHKPDVIAGSNICVTLRGDGGIPDLDSEMRLLAAPEDIDAGPTRARVAADTAVEPVIPGLAAQPVGSAAAEQVVGTQPAEQRVAAAAAIQRVVARPAMEHVAQVGAVAAAQRVPTAAARQGGDAVAVPDDLQQVRRRCPDKIDGAADVLVTARRGRRVLDVR